MKKILIKFVLFIILGCNILFESCQKQEIQEVFYGGQAPVLSIITRTKDSIPLDYSNEQAEAVYFSWTNPNYVFKSGPSSQNVAYTIEIDTFGSNFNGKNKVEISLSSDLNISYNSYQFNAILANLKLKLNSFSRIIIRLKSAVAGNSLTNSKTFLYSSIFTYKVKAYSPPPKVAVPATGDLWAVGDAFAGGWNNPLLSPYDVEQKFTKVTETRYQLEVNFLGGGFYKLIQEAGVWGTQYRPTPTSADNVGFASGSFEKRDADPGFKGASASGRYLLIFDFQEGTYTVQASN